MITAFVRSILYFSSICLFSSWASAQQNLSTTGNCSPIISNVRGSVTIQCSDKELEKRLQKTLDLRLQPFSEQLALLEKSASQNVNNLRNIEERQSTMKDTISRISASNAKVADQLIKIRIQSSTSIQNLTKDLNNIRDEFRLSEDFTAGLVAQAEEKFNHQFESIENRVETIENRIEILQNRVEKLSSDVHLIMRQFMRGELEDSVYFYSLILGKGHNGDFDSALILAEAEVLTTRGFGPFKKTSLYASIGKVDATNRKYFQTFDGAGPIILTDDNSSTRFATGFRTFSSSPGSILQYLGAEVSYNLIKSKEGTNRIGMAIAAGIEMSNRNSRSALQLAIEAAPSDHTDFSFNSVGNSTLDKKKSTNIGLVASFRVSFH